MTQQAQVATSDEGDGSPMAVRVDFRQRVDEARASGRQVSRRQLRDEIRAELDARAVEAFCRPARRNGARNRAFYARVKAATDAGLDRLPVAKSFEAARPRPNEIVTTGTVRDPPRAYVYVGVSGHRVKIGMSGDPERRCGQLGCELAYAQPVVVESVKLVETAALARLGVRRRGSEWVYHGLQEVIDAVRWAYAAVGRSRHVDPAVTAEQARDARVFAAGLRP